MDGVCFFGTGGTETEILTDMEVYDAPLGMFCLLFLTASPIENTQRYRKIVLGGVKFQMSM